MRKFARRIIFGLLFVIIVITLTGCQDDYQVYTLNLSDSFNTTNKVIIISKTKSQDELDKLYDGLDQILIDLDHKFNVQDRGDGVTTELMRLNAQSGIAPMTVSDELFMVVKKALEISNYSLVDEVYLFDPTIAPVWDKWNFIDNLYDPFMDNRADAPLLEEINVLLPLVDRSNIEINEEQKTIFLKATGMKLDLGAIVKGYAADKLKTYLISQGYEKAVIDVGRNILLLGSGITADSKDIAWKVDVQTPFIDLFAENNLKTYGSMRLSDVTVVTSGTYEKYIKNEEGVMYHHILDPRTGFPVDNQVLSVTVVCQESIVGDGFSTTLFALGLERGMAIVNELDYLDTIWVIQNNDKKEVYVSDGLKDIFDFNEAVETIGYVYKGAYNENFGN
ncbi:MAG: FAD:protein FMN transferase [Bacilli bacterium]